MPNTTGNTTLFSQTTLQKIRFLLPRHTKCVGLDSQFLVWVRHPKRLGHSLLMHCLSPNSDPITLLVSNTKSFEKRKGVVGAVGDLWWSMGAWTPQVITYWAAEILIKHRGRDCWNNDGVGWNSLAPCLWIWKLQKKVPCLNPNLGDPW